MSCQIFLTPPVKSDSYQPPSAPIHFSLKYSREQCVAVRIVMNAG
jgi:hypothetical protein